MDPKNLKLPTVGEEAFVLDPAFEKIYHILWSVDPAFLRRLKQDTLTKLAKINVDYRAKQARLEAQMKLNEAEALEAVAKEIASYD